MKKIQSNPLNLETSSKSEAFLLQEYQALLRLRQDYISLGENRFNYFLVILSASIGLATLINGLTLYEEIKYYIIAAIIVGVLLLGITTLARITVRNARIYEYTVGLKFIRGYFVENNPEIAKYLLLPTYYHSHKVSLGKWNEWFSQQFPLMLAIINSLIGSTGIAIAIWAITYRSLVLLVIVGVGLFLLFSYIQIKHYLNEMAKFRANVKKEYSEPKTA